MQTTLTALLLTVWLSRMLLGQGPARPCKEPEDPTAETPTSRAALAASCRSHLAVHARDTAAYEALGWALIDDPAAALSAYEAGLRIAPKDWSFLFNAGLQNQRLGRHRAAIALFRQAADVRSDHAAASIQAGLSAQALGDHALAMTFYQEALHREPRNPEAWGYEARSLAILGRHREAVDAWERAERYSPHGFIDEAGDRAAYDRSKQRTRR